HAEANAIANAAYQGIGLARSVCHVTHFPCASCAKLLVAAGVCAVYWAEDYRDTALAEKIFAEAAVATVRIGRWTAEDTRERRRVCRRRSGTGREPLLAGGCTAAVPSSLCSSRRPWPGAAPSCTTTPT